jgi:TPR repeat protein
MKLTFKYTIAAILLMLISSVPVAAGPLEDARAAAAQGNADAQSRLGDMYGLAIGVRQDFAEAAKWYRLAADQGNPGAQFMLGFMYARGFPGVPQDYVRAHMWFNLSAAQSKRGAAENRDKLAGQMTPAQIAEAKKLASEWKPTKQPPR